MSVRDDNMAAAWQESGFDDRVRNGCGLIVAPLAFAGCWLAVQFVNWLFPLGGAA